MHSLNILKDGELINCIHFTDVNFIKFSCSFLILDFVMLEKKEFTDYLTECNKKELLRYCNKDVTTIEVNLYLSTKPNGWPTYGTDI